MCRLTYKLWYSPILPAVGEDSEQTNRRALLFRKALAAAAIGSFVFRDRDKGATVDIDFTETAEPFTAAVKDSVGEYLARDDRVPEQDSKFAESVASTLSTGASNRLTLDVLNQLDPDGKAYKKLWLTRGDEKVRLSHRELHGRTASVGDSFKPGLAYPGDPAVRWTRESIVAASSSPFHLVKTWKPPRRLNRLI